jgi:multiple sugar transport system permease protein
VKLLKSLLLHAALILGAIATAIPLLWMISASLMPQGEATAFPPRVIPSRVTFEHYTDLFTRLSLGRAFLNSMLVAIIGTSASLLFNSMAGYAFAKLRFPGRDRIFAFLVLALAIPAQVAMLPLFLLLKSLGLVNTYLGVLIPYMSGIYGVFLVRQFMVAIPDDLLAAARIDGAGPIRQFRHVTLPELGPTFVFVGVITAIGFLQAFAEPYVLTPEGGPLNATLTIVMLMYREGFRWWNMGYAAAVAFVLFALVLLGTLAQRLLRRMR